MSEPKTAAKVEVKITRGGQSHTYELEDNGVKGRKGQFRLFRAPAACPEISNWSGLFLHEKSTGGKSTKPKKSTK